MPLISTDERGYYDFHSDNVPRNLTHDLRLCLFRVIQEALQNTLKHSNARKVELSLIGTAKEIQLTIRDTGVGFDTASVDQGHGLGLISMRERLKLLNGDFSIQSAIDRGTTIRATVPIALDEPWRMPEIPSTPANLQAMVPKSNPPISS